MASAKNKKTPPKKELSEGKAIALSVLLIVVAIIAGYFVLKFIFDFFFPGFL